LNKENNILSPELQHYSVEPPAFLFESIMGKVRNDDKALDTQLQKLGGYAVAPSFSFETIMGKINATDGLNSFKPLKHYEVEPPFSFAKIMELIRAALGGANNAVQKKRLAPVITFPIIKRIIAAAAVVLLAILGYYTIGKLGGSKDTGKPNIVQTVNPPITPSVIPNDTNKNEDSVVLPNNNLAANNNSYNEFGRKYNNASSSKKRRKIAYGGSSLLANAAIVDSVESFSIAGMKTPMVDNDFLATFASFNENALPAFLQSDAPISTIISVDQYTDIVVTDKMGAFMKKMYKTRKSGKPTRKARKAKQKLEKWKVADSTYFSNETLNNPLNPIDLGNFILKK
jgi:hypothetical protein